MPVGWGFASISSPRVSSGPYWVEPDLYGTKEMKLCD